MKTHSLITYNDGEIELTVSFEKETIWLNQVQMSELFDTSTDNVSLHLKNIFKEKELDEDATTEDFSVVRQEGNRKVKRSNITKPLSKQLKLDINKYNSQYENLKIKTSNTFHDRFLIIDDAELYHIGASLKDLGKRVFSFSKMDERLLEAMELLK